MKNLLQEMQQLAGIYVKENVGTGATIVYLNDSEEVSAWRGTSFQEAYNKLVADWEGHDGGLLTALGGHEYGDDRHEGSVGQVSVQSPVAINEGSGYFIILPW